MKIKEFLAKQGRSSNRVDLLRWHPQVSNQSYLKWSTMKVEHWSDANMTLKFIELKCLISGNWNSPYGLWRNKHFCGQKPILINWESLWDSYYIYLNFNQIFYLLSYISCKLSSQQPVLAPSICQINVSANPHL